MWTWEMSRNHLTMNEMKRLGLVRSLWLKDLKITHLLHIYYWILSVGQHDREELPSGILFISTVCDAECWLDVLEDDTLKALGHRTPVQDRILIESLSSKQTNISEVKQVNNPGNKQSVKYDCVRIVTTESLFGYNISLHFYIHYCI